MEVPRARPKLKEGAVPCLLPGCPSYYSTTTKTKRTRLSYKSKEEELLNRTIQISLTSKPEETVKYKVNTLQDVKYKLTLISLPNNWLVWYRDNLTTFILPSLIEQNISVDLYLEINCFLFAIAFMNGRNISITSNTITDIRQIESILCEISSNYSSMSNNNCHNYHINRAKDHIIEAISDVKQNDVAENILPT